MSTTRSSPAAQSLQNVDVMAGRDHHGVFVATTFRRTGQILVARPQVGNEDVARATSLGYRNVTEMTLEHDLIHSVLAEASGQSVSPSLWATVNGCAIGHDVWGPEEGRVLAVQRLLNEVRASGQLLLTV